MILAPSRTRALILAAAVAGLFPLLLVVRLAYLQVWSAPDFRLRRERETTEHVELKGTRGLILDRDGIVLAQNVPAGSIFAMTSEVSDPGVVSNNLHEQIGLDRSQVMLRLTSRQGFVWLKRQADESQIAETENLHLKGVYVRHSDKRLYPFAEAASHVLGFVDVDGHGLSGVELFDDAQLHGKDAAVLRYRDSRGGEIPFGRSKRPAPTGGENAHLSISLPVQLAAEKAIEQYSRSVPFQSGKVIVLDADSGQILALAEYPNFDPNKFSKYPDTLLTQNSCVQTLVASQRMFLALLATTELDGGTVDMPDLIPSWRRFSSGSNRELAEILLGRVRRGHSDLHERFTNIFDPDAKSGVELPGEIAGHLDWDRVKPPRGLSLSPIQMAKAMAIMVNGGSKIKPTIFRSERDSSSAQAVRTPQKALLSATSREVRSLLQQVDRVRHNEVGVGGYQIGGIDLTDAHGSMHGDRMSGFVGFAQEDSGDGRIVVFAMIDMANKPKYADAARRIFAVVVNETMRYLESHPIAAR